MSSAIKRRKVASKPAVKKQAQHATSTIGSFTRVSKSVSKHDGKKSTIERLGEERKAEIVEIATRKRKALAATQGGSDLLADEASSQSNRSPALSEQTAETSKQPRGRPPLKKASNLPRLSRNSAKRGRSPSPADSDISTANAGALFKRLRLESSPSRASSPLTTDTSIAGSDIDLDLGPGSESELPREVLDLIDLNVAFLKTLALHYAHNGTNVPVDLRTLLPNVARAWGKKRIVEDEIRTCIGVLNMGSSKFAGIFSLSKYGRGKVCIELDSTKTSGLINEKAMTEQFRENLQIQWTHFIFREKIITSEFMKTLPKAEVTLCESVAKASPILAKGQQRLEDMKKGVEVKKSLAKHGSNSTVRSLSQIQAHTNGPQVDVPMTNADGTKMSLLDRIRQKQLAKAQMPAGLSPAEQERRAALQRVDEVAALVGMLSRASSTGSGRISFTMAAMLQKLKDSFRMGISREEGAVCLRLLAREIAPEWIKVVTVAGRENVVVEVSCQLGKPEVERRVKAIVAKF